MTAAFRHHPLREIYRHPLGETFRQPCGRQLRTGKAVLTVTTHRMYCISRRGIPGWPFEECAQVWICPRPCQRRITVTLDGTVTVIFPGRVKAIYTGVALDGHGPGIVFGPDSGELAELAAGGIGW